MATGARIGEETTALTDVVARLRRALRRSIRTDYPWESMPMARVELMQVLAERGTARVGELAQVQLLAPNTVSGLVQQLVDAGLAVRQVDPTDRRASVISLTDHGVDQLRRWERANETRIAAALGTLTDGQQAAIRRALPALAALVDRLNERDRT